MTTSEMRIGSGIDVHSFEAGRRLVLGGVEIPGCIGLRGHSDADVVLHAITDALLGAVGMGDIGMHFPDSDPQWKGADSKQFVRKVWSDLSEQGWRIVNLDCTILAETPKLAPYRDEMRTVIAGLLETQVARCSIKATTTETLGFVGRKEGILAHAVVLIERGP